MTMNTIDMYIEKVDRFKKTLLRNIDMNDLRHLSSEEFDMCKQALDLFDATIDIIQYEMVTLELIACDFASNIMNFGAAIQEKFDAKKRMKK